MWTNIRHYEKMKDAKCCGCWFMLFGMAKQYISFSKIIIILHIDQYQPQPPS